MKPAIFIAVAFAATTLYPGCLPAADEMILKAEGQQRWLKGNMHTHSYWSDGDNYPELIARWYKDHGYQFLVFTDHNILHSNEKWIDVAHAKNGAESLAALKASYPIDWIKTRENNGKTEVRLKTFDEVFANLAVPQEYLLIQGEEITDKFKSFPIHLCATNLNELHTPLSGDSVTDVIQKNIDLALARRERTGVKTLVHLNHPNFGYGVTAEQLMPVVGENFFEVYNGHPGVQNSGDKHHASTERIWDIVNSFRLGKYDLPLMYGLATDDGHAYFETRPGVASQPGRGWVMVLADSLEPDSVVEALEAGKFYSSSGVTLSEIRQSNQMLAVTVQAEKGISYRIDFVGTLNGFSQDSEPADNPKSEKDQRTRVYSKQIGEVLKSVEGTTAEYRFVGTELFVRAVVTASRKHPNPSESGEFERAWVQPVKLNR